MENDKIVIISLSSLAALCILVTAGVLYAGGDEVKEVVQIIFAPVTVAISGFVGYMKH